ncbi:Uncharacterised protein [Sphingobacterium thalpophilum]|uniref:Uncharacterized protein n=1 Tax=Sphingobacterium thalpophilum TaxID=259 RepID=A0A4U9VNK7_9SPHI|nr:Uncharacterised protein [Sphingobacterium thalpophilum]
MIWFLSLLKVTLKNKAENRIYFFVKQNFHKEIGLCGPKIYFSAKTLITFFTLFNQFELIIIL